MAHYQRRGSIPDKRHTRHLLAGRLCYEELMGEEGFSSGSSLLYHAFPPSAIVDARTWPLAGSLVSNHPLLPRHLRLHELFPGEEHRSLDPVTGRRVLLANADVAISYVACSQPSPLYRDAVGDELVFLESGSARLESVFGDLQLGAGDYVVIPRATTHRIVPSGDGALRAYVVEAAGHIAPPARYRSRAGQFLEQAPYCERDLRLPGEPRQPELGATGDRAVEVYVKHRAPAGSPGSLDALGGVSGTVHVAERHPFDVVGWDGCVYPYALNVADFEPITGRVHQPPPVHQVFEGPRFVVCNFVPRKLDYHPDAIAVPYYHSNVDSDEVMFYCGGTYRARSGSGVGLGSVSLHPAGFPHGPQPAAYRSAGGLEAVDELAVMLDTFSPLLIGQAALEVEDPAYPWSWAGRDAPAR